MQQIVHRHLAVENGKHGRAAGRRSALAPSVLADPVFVRQFYFAFLDGVEDDLDRHQFHHAGRRPQFVGVLLEQHAAAGSLDQDRGRRVAVKAAIFLLRRALHAVVGGIHDPAPTDSERYDGSHQAAPRDDGRGVGFAGNGSLCCHRRCPESHRSNSWKYRKQHRVWAWLLDLPPCRSDCGTGRRNVSWRCCNFPTGYEKQGGNAMPSSRTISANGLDFFIVEQGQGPLVLLCHGWPELSYSWRHQIPAIAEAGLERDGAATMRILLAVRGFSDPAAHQFVQEGKGFLADADPTRPLPNWLTEADLAYFAAVYQEAGFRGGLNWYRNIDRNWELTAPWQGAQIHQPSLFIAGSKDGVITGLIGAKQVKEMERVLPNLRQKLILDGAGHWIQQERPDEVNAALIDFLKG